MTDKHIIDEANVSECGHYHYGKCEIDYDEWNNEIIRYNECQNNPNCYYKQLKRKEEELRNICKVFDIEYVIDKETGRLIGRCNKLIKEEQECEKLKREIAFGNNGKLSDKIRAIVFKDLNAENSKYKQALDEIKEIAEENIRIADLEGLNGVYRRGLAEQILQKINECEVKND